MTIAITTTGRSFEMTPTGLRVHGKPTLDEWIAFGHTLVDAANSLQWMIGDWINYGAERSDWGETYAQALDAFHLEYQYLRNIAWVAREFDLSRRHDKLTFSHHAEVAALDTPTQDKLLDKAEQDQLSCHQLREEVRRETGRQLYVSELDRFEGRLDQAKNWIADMNFKHGWQKRVRLIMFECREDDAS